MSPRSVLLPLLLTALFAAFAAAQWSDIMYAYAFNVTPVKMCAPSGCVFAVKLNMSNANAAFAAVAGYSDAYSTIVHPYGVYVGPLGANPINIYMPAGVYFSDTSYFSIDDVNPAQYTTCGTTWQNAIYVASSGMHNLSLPSPYNVYYIDPKSCFVYLFAASSIYNATAGNATVFLFQMPQASSSVAWTASAMYAAVLYGVQHYYYITRYYAAQYAGSGFYIANSTRVPTFAAVVSNEFYQYGPLYIAVAQSYFDTGQAPGDSLVVFNIAQTPSDGVFLVQMPDTLYGNASIAFIANGTAGYVAVKNGIAQGTYLYIYAQRYAIGDVVVEDGYYIYATRTIACPRYYGSGTGIGYTLLTRLDRANVINICSNRTDTLYAALTFYSYPIYVDVLPPGQCRVLRWDSSLLPAGVSLNIYTSAQDVCSNTYSLSYNGFSSGWSYVLFQNNTLKPMAPINGDSLYIALWNQLLAALAAQNNATQYALRQWLSNMSKSLAAYVNSLPRFAGTIMLSADTSTWLNTTLNELKKYAVTAAAAAYGLNIIQFTPAVAPAASAAIAIAWAASRRDEDLTVTAAVAGAALSLFGVLMTLLYGAAGISLVALGVVIAAAAAAWRRSSG
jgi:hypothetical protein